MKNSLGREVPDGFAPFVSSTDYVGKPHGKIPEKKTGGGFGILNSVRDLFDQLRIEDGQTLSFHHHLRNGDLVLNAVAEEIKRRNLRDMRLAPSGIFPANAVLAELIENGNVSEIHTDYCNGPAAEAVSRGALRGRLVLYTHGGRSLAIETGRLRVDVAIMAVPAVDAKGNGSGLYGPGACGSLGYADPDTRYADKVVFVTDTIAESLEKTQLDGKYVDRVWKTDRIGDPAQIVSGTTRITRDPVGQGIARSVAEILDRAGLIKEGLSMQTGAGGITLAAARHVENVMKRKGVRGSFASGGITGYHAEMLENGLLDRLYDVQCFDLAAVESMRRDARHEAISASRYAGPYADCVTDRLDFVVLGATETDTDFNVNVCTDSAGRVMGGSGGHSDAAHGASVTVIASRLLRTRLPSVRERVSAITTPGEDVDVFVCEAGAAVNPARPDLLDRLRGGPVPLYTMEELLRLAQSVSGVPEEPPKTDEPVGVILYRDGTALDTLYRVPAR